jgi:hypothetical protein
VASHYLRVGIPLSVAASIKKTAKGGSIKVKVTDLGSPVSGAVVRVGAISKVTGSRGIATLKVKNLRRYSGTVSATGYETAAFRVRPL